MLFTVCIYIYIYIYIYTCMQGLRGRALGTKSRRSPFFSSSSKLCVSNELTVFKGLTRHVQQVEAGRLRRVLSTGRGGGGGGGSSPNQKLPPPPKAPSFSPKRIVAREKEREEVGSIYYLSATIIHVNNVPLN